MDGRIPLMVLVLGFVLAPRLIASSEGSVSCSIIDSNLSSTNKASDWLSSESGDEFLCSNDITGVSISTCGDDEFSNSESPTSDSPPAKKFHVETSDGQTLEVIQKDIPSLPQEIQDILDTASEAANQAAPETKNIRAHIEVDHGEVERIRVVTDAEAIDVNVSEDQERRVEHGLSENEFRFLQLSQQGPRTEPEENEASVKVLFDSPPASNPNETSEFDFDDFFKIPEDEPSADFRALSEPEETQDLGRREPRRTSDQKERPESDSAADNSSRSQREPDEKTESSRATDDEASSADPGLGFTPQSFQRMRSSAAPVRLSGSSGLSEFAGPSAHSESASIVETSVEASSEGQTLKETRELGAQAQSPNETTAGLASLASQNTLSQAAAFAAAEIARRQAQLERVLEPVVPALALRAFKTERPIENSGVQNTLAGSSLQATAWAQETQRLLQALAHRSKNLIQSELKGGSLENTIENHPHNQAPSTVLADAAPSDSETPFDTQWLLGPALPNDDALKKIQKSLKRHRS